MNANISIGGNVRSSVPDVAVPGNGGAKVRGEESGGMDNKLALMNVQTVQDLKRIELQGQRVSIGEEQLIMTIEKVNKRLRGIPTSLEFVIHEKTHDIMIKVINQETGEVVREIPPEKILDMVASFLERAGLIIDERL